MSDLNIGKVIIDQTKTSQVTVNYADTSKPDTSTITSNRTQMTATVDSISTVFEISKTYYFDADGGLMTTDQGYGTLGTTDSDGVLTVAHLTPSLALTAPSAGTKYELEESFNVTWTSSNITLVNVILESESGGSKTYSDVDASLGTLAVAISESDGFSINETVYIYIENTHQTLEDSVQVASIATLTMDTPTLTAGTEGNVTGTSNGVEVDVYYRVSSPEGAWEVFEEGVAVSGGNWSATGTIADADTYDFIAEDTTDRDGSAQVDDVEVASGVILTALQITNASDASTMGNIVVADAKFYEDDYIVGGTVTSSKIKIGDITYLTGVGTGTTMKKFIARITKTHEVVWINFYEWQGGGTRTPSYKIEDGYIYTVDQPYVASKYVSTLKKIDPEDGSQLSLTLTQTSGYARAGFCDSDGTYMYCFGSSNGVNGSCWKVTLADFSTQVLTANISGAGVITTGFISGLYAFVDVGSLNVVNILTLSTMTTGAQTSSTQIMAGSSAISDTGVLLMTSRSDTGTYQGVSFRMVGSGSMATVVYSEKYNNAYDVSGNNYMGRVIFNGTNFVVFYNDGIKFIVRKISKSSPYSQVGDDINITPNSVTILANFASGLDENTDYILIGGYLKGSMESGFVSGDSTKYDGFIKLVEK